MGLLRALNCQKMRFFQARAHPDFPPNPNHRPEMTGKLLLVLPGPFPARRCSHGPAGRVHSPFSPLLGAQIFFLSRIWSKSGSFSGAAFSCSSKALCQQERWVNPQKKPWKICCSIRDAPDRSCWHGAGSWHRARSVSHQLSSPSPVLHPP